MSTTNAHDQSPAPASDWPLLKDRWLDALIGPGGDPSRGPGGGANGGHRAKPALELRDAARAWRREHDAAAQGSQYFEVHLAHG